MLHALGPSTLRRAKSLHDISDFGIDRCFATTYQLAGVFDQQEKIAQGKTFEQAFALEIDPAAVFDRNEPQRVLQFLGGMRASDTSVASGLTILYPVLPLDMIHASFHQRALAFFADLRDAGRYRIEIDIVIDR